MANQRIFLSMVSLVLALNHLASSCCHASKVSPVTKEEEADRIIRLPGQPKVHFQQFSGYITVDEVAGRALFYWLTEATHNLKNKPLVLWLNGGPGCSSISIGAAQELGPFLIGRNETEVTLNKYSWNEAANMLFLETPVSVGFSYTNNSADLNNLGDQFTATDSYAFLLGFFNRFPRYKSHEFYISGESYAGHYVPQLAELIHEGNKRAGNDSFINLRGLMMGNSVINRQTDAKGLIDFAWTHGIVSDNDHEVAYKECKFDSGIPLTNSCHAQLTAIKEAYAKLNIYAIYSPACSKSWLRYPCTREKVEKYFNRKDVQQAFHANVTNLPYAYNSCTNFVDWNDSPDTVLPLIRMLLDAGLRIWFYSGDTDGLVPLTSTRYSINEMKLKVKEEWRAWVHNSQVAGWVETYEEGLVFATVRGAGHTVPVFAPSVSLALFSNFLTGSSLPSVF